MDQYGAVILCHVLLIVDNILNKNETKGIVTTEDGRVHGSRNMFLVKLVR